MEERKHIPVERMEFFGRYVAVSNWVWSVVGDWSIFARDTVGKQLVRACDSVGANLVEGDGRYSDVDALHFFVIARASAREARYWIELAGDRQLMSSETAQEKIGELVGATQLLNQFIKFRRSNVKSNRVKEQLAAYDVDANPDDVFTEPLFEF